MHSDDAVKHITSIFRRKQKEMRWLEWNRSHGSPADTTRNQRVSTGSVLLDLGLIQNLSKSYD